MSKFLCPRRAELGSSAFRLPEHDKWKKRRNDDYLSCSYCGSVNPDDLLKWIEDGKAEIEPTDKNYKIYVENPDITYVPVGKMYENGKVVETKKYPRTTAHLKFYFQHFSPEQQEQFVNLVNAKKVKFGYPGYFYTLPFFVTYK